MIIVLSILFYLIYAVYAGFGITGLFLLWDKKQKLDRWYLVAAVVGYVISQLIFQFVYGLIENARASFIITLTAVTLINLLYILISYRKDNSFLIFKNHFKVQKKDLYILVVLLLMLIISSWQYIFIGMGNYFHSGNEDFFDGVNGGQSYLDNIPLGFMPEDFSGWIRLQYSSQAFTRLLLNAGGVDGFLFQAILNLFLTAIGVYWLVVTVFNGSNKTGLWASFWSVCANFYLTTFLNGHIGSMMYGAMAPVFIGLVLLWIRKEINSLWLILIFLLLYSIHITYPGPIFFLLIPAVLLLVYNRILNPKGLIDKLLFYLKRSQVNKDETLRQEYNWKRVILIGAVLLLSSIIFTVLVYNYFEPRRIQALLRTNVSWKISLFKEMLMIFWGIYPSGSTGILSALPILISNEIINNIALIFAGLLTLSAFLVAVKNKVNEHRQFLFLYSVFFIPFFIMMRYFWGSPYYFYKFLYVNYFIIAIILLLWVADFIRKHKKGITKNIIIGLLIFIGILNIFWDFSIDYDYYTRPYNDKNRIEDLFAHTNQTQIAQSYIDIPNFLYDLVFRYIFKEHGFTPLTSRKDAKYIIQLENMGNVYHNSLSGNQEIFNNGLLKLFEPPSDNNMSSVTMYEPEHAGKININWIGNELSLKRGILLSSINELTEYLEKSGNTSKTYIDITDKDTYIILNEAFKSKTIALQRNPEKADWFIRLKGGKTIVSDSRQVKKIWNNDFFEIIGDYSGSQKRVNELPEIPNFSGLVKEIKANGNKIYLDIPDSEHLYLFLEQFLIEQGVNITSQPAETEYFCRCIFNKDYEKFNFKKYSSANEKFLWQSTSFNVVQRPWEVQLVKIPINGRITSENSKYDASLPFAIAAYRSLGDYQIKLSKLSDRANYLRLLLSPGPSIDFSPFVMKIENPNNGKSLLFNIENPKSLIDLKISDLSEKPDTSLELILLGQNLFGRSLLPLDDRYLNYQIQALELTDRNGSYSDYALRALNNIAPSRLDKFMSFFIKEKKIIDIINEKDSSNIFLGTGWYPIEENKNETYRWAGSNPAEIILNNIDKRNNVININLEPGPGCGNNPLHLKIFNSDQLLNDEIISGRKNIKVQIPPENIHGKRNQFILKLIPITPNNRIESDPRILNFRVFNIEIDKSAPRINDIIDENNINEMQIGKGWYSYETFNHESFRWVGKDPAEILVADLDSNYHKIKINLEPGPGCAGKPLQMNIFFNNTFAAKKSAEGRTDILLDIPDKLRKTSGNPIAVKIVPLTKNSTIKTDKRILNFRTFKISLIK